MKKLTSYSQYLIHLFVMICGIVGVIGGMFSSLEFPLEANFCILIFIIIAMFLYYLYSQKRKRVGIYVIVSEILLGIYLFVLRSMDLNNLIAQLEYIMKYDYYLKVTDLFKNATITDLAFVLALIILIGLPIIYLIVSIVMRKKFVVIRLVLLLFVFILPIIIKHPLSKIAGYAFTIFLIYSFVFSFLIHKESKQVVHQTIIITIMAITLLFSSVFLETNPIFKSNSLDVIFKLSSWIEENQINQWFNTQNSTGASASINGALPNGNVTIDGRVALKVKSTQPFSAYLRSYSLGYYTNNRWQPVKKEYKGVQNNCLINLNVANGGRDDFATVEIEMERQTKYQIVPYYPLFNEKIIDDSYYKKVDKPINVNISKNIAFMERNEYFDDNDYHNYVLQEYMEVPDNLQSKFQQIVDKQLLWHSEDIRRAELARKVTFVKKFLNEYTNYDLNAGSLPVGKDFVEYFLFENQKGSCTHYASTATLLLRYLGVPTRYVSGFVMTTSDFDKYNEAIIRNNRAHSWVEVYMQGVGWLPYDFTKSTDTFTDTSETSMVSQLDYLLNRQNEGALEPVVPERKPQDPLNLDPRGNDVPGEEVNTDVEETPWYDVIVQYSQYLYMIGGGILIFIVYRYGQKTYILTKIKKAENNQKIILMYQRMILIDKQKTYINEDIIDIAYKAKFSQHLINEKEVGKFNSELKLLQAKVYDTLPWYQKILYKYILGYM